MHRIVVACVFLMGILAFISEQAFAQEEEHGGRPLTATLSGEAVVSETGGDPDGTGTAELTLNQGQGQICFEIDLENVEAHAAHIHSGIAGENGPPVVTLVSEAGADLSDCVDAEADLINEIRQSPANYYVQVHNDEYPAGAVRGPLTQ